MAWVSPTGFDDPTDNWLLEANAYDGDTETFAREDKMDADGYLELTLTSAVDCDKVQIYARATTGTNILDPDLDIDLHYDGGWHNIFSGVIVAKTWVEKTNPAGTKSVDRARVKSNELTRFLMVYEFDFWEVTVVTHEWEGSDGIAIGEVLVKNPIKVLSDGIAFTDTLIKNPIKTLIDGIAIGEALEKVYTHVRTFTDGIAIADVLVKSISKVLTDGIAFTDTLKKLWVHGVLRILNAVRNLLSVREEGKKR